MVPKVIFVPILQEEAVYEEPTPKFEPPPPPQPMLVPVSKMIDNKLINFWNLLKSTIRRSQLIFRSEFLEELYGHLLLPEEGRLGKCLQTRCHQISYVKIKQITAEFFLDFA